MSTTIIDNIERQVNASLRLPPEDVFNFKLETGIRYLDNVHPDFIKCALKNSREFWNWWRALWANRDRQLLERIKTRDNGFSYFNEPVSQLSTNWVLGTQIAYTNAMTFYTSYHQAALAGFAMYPNDDVVKAALKRQESQEKVNV